MLSAEIVSRLALIRNTLEAKGYRIGRSTTENGFTAIGKGVSSPNVPAGGRLTLIPQSYRVQAMQMLQQEVAPIVAKVDGKAVVTISSTTNPNVPKDVGTIWRCHVDVLDETEIAPAYSSS